MREKAGMGMSKPHINGQMWYDTDGNEIQAHGGCIVRFGEKWYWYGDHKGKDNLPGTRRVEYIGMSCYSSTNLRDWQYEGLVLKADPDNPESPVHTSKVNARPAALYNEKTQKYVLWWHYDTADYQYAGIGVGVADRPEGPFEIVRTKRPNNKEARDLTVFQDVDGTAYLFHAKDRNMNMGIARLTEDYLDVDGFYVTALQDQEREAPAVCFHNGMYYMVTSGCSGWDPNAALYATSRFAMGPWQLIDNPCEGENYRNTFDGQSTHIFEAEGKHYLMLDHFHAYHLRDSGYSILPITFDDKGKMTVTWQSEWKGI